MIPYFLVWAWIGGSALSRNQRWSQSTTLGIWLLFTLLIGLRVEVGADWFRYLGSFNKNFGQQVGTSFSYPFTFFEPGYALASWISANLNWGIFGVNLICAALFSTGLVRYCRQQPYPWLALLLAYPYLAVVVTMNYTGQGVAIGLELLALLALERERLLWFLAWIALAASFHSSALLMLVFPVATVRRSMGRLKGLLNLVLLAGAGYGLYTTLLAGAVDTYQYIYLERQYQSEGALIRVILCLLPALIFLWQRRRFPITPQQRSIYTLMSWLAVAAAVGLVFSPSSTAIDRAALYLIPLQIFVGSNLPSTHFLGTDSTSWRTLLVLFTLAVLSVWMFFSSDRLAWLPYRNLLFDF